MLMDMRSLLRRPIHLVLDWDGTVTKKDTLNFVGEIGLHHRKNNSWLDEKYGKLPPWSHFADAWIKDFSAHQAHYEPRTDARTTVQDERAWLASLAPIENRSVRRVERSGLFRGVTDCEDVEVVASAAVNDGRLQLRRGWDALLLRLMKSHNHGIDTKDNHVSILSVNWSGKFIRHALSHFAMHCNENLGTEEDASSLKDIIKSMPVQANEIVGIESVDGSDGSLTKNGSNGIRTSADKLEHMPECCRHRLDINLPTGPNGTDEGRTVIYVGDSATDFECLLAADIGICIRDEPMGSSQRELAETLERVGVEILHVGKASSLDRNERKTVFRAADLQEIAEILPSPEG